MRIKIGELNQIRAHSEKVYPEECCGLLLGEITNQGKKVLEIRETENSWNEEEAECFQESGSKRNRFSIAPATMVKVQKEARDRSLEIIGIYHSHPDHQAIPSAFDKAIAWPSYSYIIVSVEKGKVNQILSWTLDEHHQFQTEEILTNCED